MRGALLRQAAPVRCQCTSRPSSSKRDSFSTSVSPVLAAHPAEQNAWQRTALVATTLAASLSICSQPALASPEMFRSIGDYVSTQQNLVGVDENKDGEVSPQELAAAYRRAGAVDMPQDVLMHELHMYDLDADGRLTMRELATGSALDAVLGPDYLDGDLWAVLDKDKNDAISYQEWMSGIGDVGGAAGEDIKDLIFRKVDNISIKDGELDEEETYYALQRLRNVVLGYDPADYEFEDEELYGGEFALDEDIVGLRPY